MAKVVWGFRQLTREMACTDSLRACFKNRPGKGLRARRGGWRGVRREHIREKSVTDEQRSHPPRPAARPTGIFLKHALRISSLGTSPHVLFPLKWRGCFCE